MVVCSKLYSGPHGIQISMQITSKETLQNKYSLEQGRTLYLIFQDSLVDLTGRSAEAIHSWPILCCLQFCRHQAGYALSPALAGESQLVEISGESLVPEERNLVLANKRMDLSNQNLWPI